MSLINGYMVWVDGEPTKSVGESLEIAKSIALHCVAGNNCVEIKTTDGLLLTWRYNDVTEQFDEIS